MNEEAAKGQGEPVAWAFFDGNGVLISINEQEPPLPTGFDVRPLFTHPPSTALSIELVLREAAEICDEQIMHYKTHWHEDINEATLDFAAEAVEVLKAKVLSLIPSPPSLEDHDKELAMRVARAILDDVGYSGLDVNESVISEVLREWK